MSFDSSLNITLDSNHDAVFYVLGKEKLRLNNLGIDISGKLMFSNESYIGTSAQDDSNTDELRIHKGNGDGATYEAPFRLYGDKRVGIGRLSESYPRLNNTTTTFGLDLHSTSSGSQSGIKLTNVTTSDGCSMYYDGSSLVYRNNSGGPIRFKYGDTTGMTIAANGCVGIGKTDPTYCLHLGYEDTNAGGNNFTRARMAMIGSSSNRRDNYSEGSTSYSSNVSLRVDGRATANAYVIAVSDRRVKKNIKKEDTNEILQQFRCINPAEYYYKDQMVSSTGLQAGLIAQDIETILPYTIKTIENILPNILKLGSYYIDSSNNKMIQFSDFDTNLLEVDSSNNIYPKIKVFDEEINEFNSITITKVVSSHSIQIETNDKLTSNVFVYGQYVDNFKTIDYDQVFSTFIASMKEIDKQLQNEKRRTVELQKEFNQLVSFYQQNND